MRGDAAENVRQGCGQPRRLGEQRRDNDEDGEQKRERGGRGDQRDGERPPEPGGLEAADQRIEQIGDRRGEGEGQHHIAEQPQRGEQGGERAAPETQLDPCRKGHLRLLKSTSVVGPPQRPLRRVPGLARCPCAA